MREDEDCIKVSAEASIPSRSARFAKTCTGRRTYNGRWGANSRQTLEDCRKMLVEAMPSYDEFIRTNTARDNH